MRQYSLLSYNSYIFTKTQNKSSRLLIVSTGNIIYFVIYIYKLGLILQSTDMIINFWQFWYGKLSIIKNYFFTEVFWRWKNQP